METQLKLIPASEHPTALESQWLNAISPADFINNNKNFDVLMMKYRCAIREIQTKLEVLDDEFSAVNKRNPISSIKSRVKSPASIYEKLRRRDLPFTEDSIVKNLDDVAGSARLSVTFIQLPTCSLHRMTLLFLRSKTT